MKSMIRNFAIASALTCGLAIPAQSFADEDTFFQPANATDNVLANAIDSTSETIRVPPGHRLVLQAFVTEGTQTYRCSAAATFEFVGPTAMFRGNAGQYVAHSFGPSFHYHDGSTVVGTLITSLPRENTIPELLLGVVQHSGPQGLFSNVSFVQRLRTQGGVPPARCNPNDTKPLTVPYFAIYRFWAPK